MSYAIEIAKGGASTSLSPLSAPEALQRMMAAEASGIAVTCTDADGKRIPKEDLQEAARQGSSRNHATSAPARR